MVVTSDVRDGRAVCRVALPGGRTLVVRPMSPDDGESLVLLFAALDEEDAYRRFFSARPPPDTFVTRMANVRHRGGFGLVASIESRHGESPRGPGRLVAEATYELLPNGDGELGITVAPGARGWLGPYLLDTLAQEAARRGVPNLEADVLATNHRMLAMLRVRGYAVLGHEGPPEILRLVVGTTGRVPSWPRGGHGRRLLLEQPGARWHAEAAARRAGFEVLACPGPGDGWHRCPAVEGRPCPLVTGADVVIDGQPGELGRTLLQAHRRLHPSVPLCVEQSPGTDEAWPGVIRVPRDADDETVVSLLGLLTAGAPTR